MSLYTEISRCRICKNTNLTSILHLGEQALTGIFPKTKDDPVGIMPLELVKCTSTNGSDVCGLLQLRHSGDLSQMYGLNYGYRSGLNTSMVAHLHGKVRKIQQSVKINDGDLIIDIGSNDSTTLQAYPKNALLVGIDPTGVKFKSYYPEHIRLIPDFFDAKLIRSQFGEKKAKVVTAFSMFYDLEDPIDFMRQIHGILADDGIWVFEQSYMPAMLEMHSYDTICHEHLEYYGLSQIKYMTDRVGFKIIDVEFNAVNGGSFSVTVAKTNAPYEAPDDRVSAALAREKHLGLDTTAPFERFKKQIIETKKELLDFLKKAKADGKTIVGYGASTKGNVLLQYCDINEKDLACIAEVNESKFGCFTPGTKIPIVSEKQAKALKPDYFLVFPWHFKDNIIGREQEFIDRGGKLVFPLPHLEVVPR